MKFNDLFVSRTEYFTVGTEEESGDYYVSIPVRNSKVEYSEYYRIPAQLYEQYKPEFNQLLFVVEECRSRLRDEDLIIKPGTERGWPL